jgi:hypothetical protein
MAPSKGNGGVHDDAAGRALDAAIAALVAALDEARSVALDASRPFTERAVALARAGRSLPPARRGSATTVD